MFFSSLSGSSGLIVDAFFQFRVVVGVVLNLSLMQHSSSVVHPQSDRDLLSSIVDLSFVPSNVFLPFRVSVPEFCSWLGFDYVLGIARLHAIMAKVLLGSSLPWRGCNNALPCRDGVALMLFLGGEASIPRLIRGRYAV
jgi:hypothetical protein